MLILDTNHFSEAALETSLGIRLETRLRNQDQDAFLTVITAQESLSGWLAQIQPHRQHDRGVRAYSDFQDCLTELAKWTVLPWSGEAADIFDRLRKLKLGVGPMDLRIACIALEYDATVLTRNRVDFEKIPGLKVENWLD